MCTSAASNFTSWGSVSAHYDWIQKHLSEDDTDTCAGSPAGTEKTPVNGGWSHWGNCSATCGGGSMTRTCTDPSPANGGAGCVGKSRQDCNMDDCGGNSEPSDGSCVNDDRTRDTEGDTCTDHYDDYPQDCGHFDTRGFNANRQCCACRRPHQPPGETTSKKPHIGHPGDDVVTVTAKFWYVSDFKS